MFTKSSLVLSFCASGAYAAFVPPTRLDVPIIFGAGGRPMMSVGMGTQGSGQIQNFNFTLTTSLGYTSVANKGCSNCSNTPLYDISLSPQAKSLDGQPAVPLGAGNFSGSLVKENCTLATKQGTPWPYTNQTIVLMDNESPSSPFQNGVSGLLGLGTLKRSTNANGFSATFDDGLYGQYYIRNPEASNFTFGLALKPSPVIPSDSSSALTIPPDAKSLADGDAGTIHWLQPDPDAYQSDKVQWRPVEGTVVGGYLSGNDQPDLTVQLDGWSAKIGSNSVGNSDGILVNIDPYYSGIYMPTSQARLIHDAIPGSQQTQKSTIPGQTNSWTVPCNAAVQFTVTIGPQQFTVDQSLLVVNQGDGTCISLIEGFSSSSVTQYIFGQTWISQLYVIFNIPKDGNPALAFAPRSVSSIKSRDIGAIVGGTVGGVAGVIAVGLIAFYFIRRRQDNALVKRVSAYEDEAENAHKIDPFIPPTTAATAPAATSPPTSPHQPLLLDPQDHHDDPRHEAAPPPTYAESESSTPRSPAQFRPEKRRYTSSGSSPVSPNAQTTFSGSGPSHPV